LVPPDDPYFVVRSSAGVWVVSPDRKCRGAEAATLYAAAYQHEHLAERLNLYRVVRDTPRWVRSLQLTIEAPKALAAAA
jgi:hypothetical protein